MPGYLTIAGQLVRRFAPLLLLLAGILLALYVTRRIYAAGFDAGTAQGQLLVADARLEAAIEAARLQKRIIESDRAMRELEQHTADALAIVASTGEVQVVTVERVIHENPEFAAVVRPAGIDRVRQQQLDAIAQAAARGSAAAAELPGAGLRAMRGAGAGNRPDPR